VQCHHPNWKVTLADCAADNGLHGRLIVGEPRPLPKKLEEKLRTVEVELYRGDTFVDRGVGSNVLGSPLAALAHLLEVLAKQPEAPPLAAGEVVTTGVITDAHPVLPGERWRTRISGLELPGLGIEFTP
jgi:2-oxo-3-hexenedioate decarboxylase